MKPLRSVVPLVGAAALVAATSGVSDARSDVLRTSTAASAARCSASLKPMAGAPRDLGFTATAGSVPVWSARTGPVVAASGETAFSLEGGCVVAFMVSNGHELWSWRDQQHPYLAGVVASHCVVVVATGTMVGRAPAAVFPVINHLFGLDAATGRQLWSRAIRNDGQSVPAVFAGTHLVLSLASGTVLGLDPATGSTAWSDGPPASCRLNAPEAADVNAAVSTGGARTTIEYQCVTAGDQINPADGMITEINPVNGTTEWRFRPGRWTLQYQSTVASSDRVTTVIGTPVIGSGSPITGVPSFSWDLGPAGYETNNLVALDQSDGRPRWTMSGIPADAAVLAGRSQLCVVSQYGVSCRAAMSGTELWEWRAPALPASPSAGNPVAAVNVGSSLYLAAPTPAASQIDMQSTTQREAAGVFQLEAKSMTNGAVNLTIPLPAFYNGPRGIVVSPMSPPGVEAVSNGAVLVSPQSGRDITEAFKIT